jgi:hypothetical protein
LFAATEALVHAVPFPIFAGLSLDFPKEHVPIAGLSKSFIAIFNISLGLIDKIGMCRLLVRAENVLQCRFDE